MSNILEKKYPVSTAKYVKLPDLEITVNVDKICYITIHNRSYRIYFNHDTIIGITEKDYNYLIQFLNMADGN